MSATRSGSPRAPAARGAAGELTTAFVLSGGASLGALQVGMLHALYERGIVPDLLVATSLGALNAAFVASRPQTVTTARELGRVWRDLAREDIFPVSMSALIGGFCGPRNHLVPDRGLRRLVAGTSSSKTSPAPLSRCTWLPSIWSPVASCCCRRDRRSRQSWPRRRFPGSFRRSRSPTGA